MSYPSRFVEFFGPCMWKTLHSISFNFPEYPSDETRKNYVDFFRNLGNVIPCPECGRHYSEYIEENPIDATNRDTLSMWLYKLHESVNLRTKKKSGPSYEQVAEEYSGWNQNKHSRFLAMGELGKKRLGNPNWTNQENLIAASMNPTTILFFLLLILPVLLYLVIKLRKK